jgi:hypothetical protein
VHARLRADERLGEIKKLTPSERSVTRSSMAKARAFNLSFSLGYLLNLIMHDCEKAREGGGGRPQLKGSLERTNHLVKVFCCTLTHCFSTVNIFNQGEDIPGPIGGEEVG